MRNILKSEKTSNLQRAITLDNDGNIYIADSNSAIASILMVIKFGISYMVLVKVILNIFKKSKI